MGRSHPAQKDSAISSHSLSQAVAIAAMTLLLVPAAHSAEEWVQHFSHGAATAVATDTNGNVFVTGPSPTPTSSGILTLKYSPAGLLLWTNRFNDSPYGNNTPHGLAVDGAGNVIVAAACTSSNGFYDFVVIKYSNSGLPLWTNRYNGPGDNDDTLAGMAIDSQGNVFVTGSSAASHSYPYNDPVNLDYATVAYSNDGVPLWTNRYNGPGNQDDYPTAISVDPGGNVFVTGFAANPGSNNFDYVTLKYSPSGAALWTNRYAAGNQYPKAIATDSNGNVFITGRIASNTYFDYLTLKYSAAGALLWTNVYAGPGGDVDDPQAIGVDAQGNVFVTGYSRGADNYPEIATTKYSNTGLPLWTNRYGAVTNGETIANAMALDAAGNVIVTGFFDGGSTAYDIVTLGYSNKGLPLSTNQYASVGNYWDQANAVTVDQVGNIFVAGLSETTNGNDFTLIKYSPLNLPLLSFQSLPNALVLNWPAGFKLQASPSLDLPFTNVPVTRSPYTNSLGARTLLFRLSN